MEQKERAGQKLKIRSTTILGVKHNGSIAIAGDGQVSMGHTVIKHNAKKVRRIYQDKIVIGFAGATADAITLYEKFEGKLEQYRGNLTRAAVELAKEWRTDRILRRLEALLIAADKNTLLTISGSGDVIEPDDGIVGIGSGGPYAAAAAKALIKHSTLSAKEIARTAVEIAADICVYTNPQIVCEEL